MPPNRKEPKESWRTPIICGALLLLTLAVYWPTLGHDFVDYDDPDYATANPHVQSGINKESVVWAFTTGHTGNWHPLTWVSHELDCQIYGKNPRGPHFTNLAFHVANTLLLFGVLRMMTGAVWRSAFVAALFAWHPTHVESVAWISERKDVLSAFFWLLTMLAYVRYVQQSETGKLKAKIYYGLSLVCFVLGLMSKPMLVTLPFVLLLLDYWPLKRIQFLKDEETGGVQRVTLRRAFLEKTPFLLLAGASSVVTFIAQQKGGAVVTLSSLPVGGRCANALVSYLRYLGELFWPENLSVLYPRPSSWAALLVVTAAAVVAGLSALAAGQAKKRPYLFVGWFWFAGTLVPVIGLVQVGIQSMADRYMYVPAIGLFIAVAWGVAELTAAWPGKRALLGAGVAIILTACCLVTRAQIRYWTNSETLFRRAIQATSDNYLAYNNLGYFLENHGKPEEAVGYYRKSVEINPAYEEAQNNLGHVLAAQGKYEEAIAHLQAALKIKPSLVEARNNLGNALGGAGRENEAIEQYELSLQYDPNDPDAHNNLGIARAMQGRLDEAERLLREAVRLNPSDAGAHLNLGNVLALKHQLEDAIREYKTVLKLNPDDSQTHYNLGNVFMERGQLAEAADEYVTAIKLKPENPDAHFKLGQTLAAQGKRDKALAHYREALRLNPKLTEAQRQIDTLLSGK